MSKKALFITGGARRVGAALAVHFARAGYDIALHYHHSEADAKQVQSDVQALGVQCLTFCQDMRDSAGLGALMSRVHEQMPHCNALINNASVFERAAFMDTDEALFDAQFSVNFKAPFFLTQAFAKIFTKGCVINILDTDIVQTQGSHFAYLLSKKALAEFTLMAARALAPAFRINGVCPGIMLPSNELDEPYIKALAERLPLQGIASVDQLADAAQFLVENTHVTGQLLFTDGGQHLL